MITETKVLCPMRYIRRGKELVLQSADIITTTDDNGKRVGIKLNWNDVPIIEIPQPEAPPAGRET